MNPFTFSCVVCGQDVDHYDNSYKSWLGRFRILYSSPTGTFVSGVGLNNDRARIYAVPLRYTSRSDDPEYSFSDYAVIAVMTQHPINDRYGFLFHEACWALLEKVHHPQAVPYSRLYEVCKSMPIPLRGTGISWGHDFGGMVHIDNKNYYPWEDRVFQKDAWSSKIVESANRNPLNVPEVERLVKNLPQSISMMRKLRCTRQARQNTEIFSKLPLNADTFSTLPMEIRDMIACLLSTSDVDNLQLASRAFSPIFADQRFWATRFGPHSDRDWLFESWNIPGYKDWRWLYRCTYARSSAGLRNRKRVWDLVKHIREILNLQWKVTSEPSGSHWKTRGMSYREVAGDLSLEKSPGSYHDFHEGCRLLHWQYVSIPQSLSQIAFSTAHVGDTEYISGMRIVSSDGAVTELGYWSEKTVYSANITSLRELHVAVGSRGIQAIQIIGDKQHTSQWLGSPKECPKTRYLAVSTPIKTMKAGYDGCKMVSLGVEYEDLSAINRPIKETKSLRYIGLWYPEVPGPNLFLNEYPSLVNGHSPPKYRPLVWASFGGPGGIYLRSLTGITVTLGWDDSLICLQFTYDSRAIPTQFGKLGGRKQSCYGKTRYFAIDGPGGEIIEAVEISLNKISLNNRNEENPYSFLAPGSLMGLKISTNRGRHCSFSPPSVALAAEVKAITIAPGTTITGFYVGMDGPSRLTSLGVISEVIENKTDEKSVP